MGPKRVICTKAKNSWKISGILQSRSRDPYVKSQIPEKKKAGVIFLQSYSQGHVIPQSRSNPKNHIVSAQYGSSPIAPRTILLIGPFCLSLLVPSLWAVAIKDGLEFPHHFKRACGSNSEFLVCYNRRLQQELKHK